MPAPERYRVGDVLVDVSAGLASRGGRHLALPPLTFELLVALVRRHPGFLRREDLLDALWPTETVTDQTLSHRVLLLRRALGDHAAEPTYVAGERGWGYRIVAPVERLVEAAAPTGAVGQERRRRALAVCGALLAAAVAVALLRSGDRAAAPRAPAVGRSDRARRLCQRAEFFWLAATDDGLRRARRDYAEVIAVDAGCASAHAGVAVAAAVAALLGYRPPGEAGAECRRAGRRALELDPLLAQAHAAVGLGCLLFDWNDACAGPAAGRAAELDPSDPAVVVAEAVVLLAGGRHAESLERVRTGDLPPSALLAFLEGQSLRMQGRWAEAALAFERALALEPALDPARRGRAECLACALGRIPAGPEWATACALGGPTPVDTARACILAGDEGRASESLEQAIAGRWPVAVFLPHETGLQTLAPARLRRRLAGARSAPDAG